MATGNLPSLILPRTDEGKRICQVIKVRPEHLDEYKKVGRWVWDEAAYGDVTPDQKKTASGAEACKPCSSPEESSRCLLTPGARQRLARGARDAAPREHCR